MDGETEGGDPRALQATRREGLRRWESEEGDFPAASRVERGSSTGSGCEVAADWPSRSEAEGT